MKGSPKSGFRSRRPDGRPLLSEVLVDAEFSHLLSEPGWYIRKPKRCNTWYVCRNVREPKQTVQYLHRIIANPGHGMVVDHINRNGLDNRKSNLRVVTRQQNNWNVGMSRRNTSGLIGVQLCSSGKWKAVIAINGVRVALGTFADKEEAFERYRLAAIEARGEFTPKELLR